MGHRRGVAILISNWLNFEKVSEMVDKEGGFILVRGKIDGCPVTLLNIYAPPGSGVGFFKKLTNIMATETGGLLICGWDLNIHIQPRIDSSIQVKPEKKLYIKK